MEKLVEIEEQIRNSLQSMAEFLSGSNWRGREREVISLFAFCFLAQNIKADKALYHPGQIGIEVAVPQLSAINRKILVCKDLVLWPKPYMTCWADNGKEYNKPIVIMEWKARTNIISQHDEQWLKEYSNCCEYFIGFTVSINPNRLQTRVIVNKVYRGKIYCDWFNFNAV